MKATVTAALLALAVVGLAEPPDSSIPIPTVPTTRPITCSYVGLLTVDVPPALEAQVGLPPGLGVVVQAVDDSSPAAKAGLSVHDIITRMDDQLVINPPQFSVLVRLHRPGQTVKLELLRHGKTITVPVQLAECALVPIDDPTALRLPPNGSSHVSSSVTFRDEDHAITITARDDDRHIRVTDRSGTVLYDGPLNTQADHDRLPDDVRDKVTHIEQNWERVQAMRSGATP